MGWRGWGPVPLSPSLPYLPRQPGCQGECTLWSAGVSKAPQFHASHQIGFLYVSEDLF